jgi:DNA-binding response OmpR family regulator
MEGTILLVEDEPIFRRNLALFLKTEGYSVADAGSGAAALDLMSSSSFDAVISDFRLGNKVNGLDVLTRFEQCFPGKSKILVSGTLTDLKRRCESLGALFIHKPLQLDELLIKLKSLLARQSAAGKLAPAITTADADAGHQWRERIRCESDTLRRDSAALCRRFQENQARYYDARARMRKLQVKIVKQLGTAMERPVIR